MKTILYCTQYIDSINFILNKPINQKYVQLDIFFTSVEIFDILSLEK